MHPLPGLAVLLAELTLFVPSSYAGPAARDSNRLAYLDGSDPFYVSRSFPKLTTPQWIGEDGVEAAVILAIDDLRDPARYEAYLRPILERLKRIDGRAPVSIMVNSLPAPQGADHPLLRTWIEEGLSLETHTLDHPCPLLGGGDFAKAKATYDGCVDLLASVPGNRPVAFRVPCMDSLNTTSPRFFAEVFNGLTPRGRFLLIDSSVSNVFTPGDPELPRDLVLDPDGRGRFLKYLPSPSFVTTIEDYPYPYLIGRRCFELPCVVPSDWQAQKLRGPNHAGTVSDLKAALDATVVKRGVFTLVFHPHGWIRNDQIVELIDHAAAKHGRRLKFLNFREAEERLRRDLFAGESWRTDAAAPQLGQDNGVRLIDLNADGFLDVVVGSGRLRLTRIWEPDDAGGPGGRWRDGDFPLDLVSIDERGESRESGARFGILGADRWPCVLLRSEQTSGAWSFRDGRWIEKPGFLRGIEIDGQPVLTARGSLDRGVRLRDLDEDGACELLVSNPTENAVFRWSDDDERWSLLPLRLPEGAVIAGSDGRDRGLRFVDLDGDLRNDVVSSNETAYGAWLFSSMEQGWSRQVAGGRRGAAPELGREIPAIARGATQNGAWFHSRHLWVQNEDTAGLKDLVDRLSFDRLLGDVEAEPLDPQAALAAFRTAPGFRVELAAAEPLVRDPVAFDWGPDGRLWVAEMADYPSGMDGKGQPGGRVVVLEDADGDGAYDRSVLFLDGLNFPTAVRPWGAGALVTAAPEILYAEDTDGDGRADLQKTLYTGFVEGNQQHRVNTLAWGLDNWLHCANGDSGGTVRALVSGEEAKINGRDFRVKLPEGLIEVESGMTQFGRTSDDWGNWFGCSNPNPIFHFVLDDRYLRRNPHAAPPRARHDVVAPAGEVFPRSRTLPRFNDLHMANRFTSCCGLVVYRDELFGPNFQSTAFVSEPAHNLVHRIILEPEGTTFRGRRAPGEERSEFLASTDNWFRPTTLRVGPDGSLWIADMYRKVIEHPQYFYFGRFQGLDVRAGEDRGRIWRVLPVGAARRPVPRLDRTDNAGLVALLASPSGWLRDKAQELLVTGKNATRKDATAKDPSAVQALRETALDHPQPLARLHALCTLEGLDAIEASLLEAALRDPHAGVRRHAVRLSEPFLGANAKLGEALLALAGDRDPQLRLQLVYTLGEWDSSRAGEALGRLAVECASDHFLSAAVLSSALRNLDSVIAAVLAATTAATRSGDAQLEVAAQLVPLAGALGRPEALGRVLDALATKSGGGFAEWQLAGLAGLLDALASLDVEPKAKLAGVVQHAEPSLAEVFRAARALAVEEAAPEPLRLASVRLLGRCARRRIAPQPAGETQPGETDAEVGASIDVLGALLGPQSPAAVQTAAVESLGLIPSDEVPGVLLRNWQSHGPQLRSRVLDRLLSRTQWLPAAVRALSEHVIQPGELDASRRRRLVELTQGKEREEVERLLSASAAPSVEASLARFTAAKQLQGRTDTGAVVFQKRCAPCHRLAGSGHAVGPDLTALADRSFDALLAAVIDPNRAVESKYVQYTAVLRSGAILSGIIQEERSTSVTLLGQDGKQDVLLRRDLVQLESSGKSLMPESIEKDLSVEDLADLFALLKESFPAPKTFIGNEPRVVRPAADGSLDLSASTCEVHGPTLEIEPQHLNLGMWSSAADMALWRIELPRARRYKVEIHWACAADSAGNRYVLEGPQGRLGGRVEATRSWNDYQKAAAGELELDAGPQRLIFRAEGPIRGYLVDLKGVVLRPAE